MFSCEDSACMTPLSPSAAAGWNVMAECSDPSLLPLEWGAGFQDLFDPTMQLEEITWHVWTVLATSFAVDGRVLYKSIQVRGTDRSLGRLMKKLYTGMQECRPGAPLVLASGRLSLTRCGCPALCV